MEGAQEGNRKGTMASLAIVAVIAICFFLWGLLVFFSVGDKGSPDWDFGVVQDVPGESPYATQFTQPRPQHVSE
jgi:hypothetical protein